MKAMATPKEVQGNALVSEPPSETMLTPALIGPAYFREIAALLAAGGPPDPAKVAEVMAGHGLVAAASEVIT